MLGYFSCVYNPRVGEFDVVPLRLAQFHLNLVQVFNNKPWEMSVKVIHPDSNPAAGEFSLDVTLENPYKHSIYRGFDVRGIVFGDGPEIQSSKNDPDLNWLGPGGMHLKNADGWTRWWNPTEFTDPGLFGYLAGNKGPNFVPKTSLNPYKYFANTLSATENVWPDVIYNAEERGNFSTEPGGKVRRYEIQFPMSGGVPVARFQYAIDASWAKPTGGGAVPEVKYFPSEANCEEPFYIRVRPNNSTAYYTDDKEAGGKIELYLDIFDWYTLGDDAALSLRIDSITLSSPTLFAGTVNVSVYPGTSYDQYVSLDVFPTSREDQVVLLTVTLKDPHSYAPPWGGSAYPVGKKLAAYQLITIPINEVKTEVLAPVPDLDGATDVEPSSSDDLAFFLDNGGLNIVNVVNADSTSIIDKITPPPSASYINHVVRSGMAYVLDSDNNLEIVKVDPIANAKIVNIVPLPNKPTAIDVQGKYAYITDSTGKLKIVDVDPPESANVVNTISIAGLTVKTAVKVQNGYAFIATGNVSIMDVDPPELAGLVNVINPTTGSVMGVGLSDKGFAYIGTSTDFGGALEVWDINDVGSPKHVTSFDYMDQVNEMECVDDIVYATSGFFGLKALKFDPASRRLLPYGTVSTTYGGNYIQPGQLAVEGGRAYVVDLLKKDPLIIQFYAKTPVEGWTRNWAGPVSDARQVTMADSDTICAGGSFNSINGPVDFDPGALSDPHESYGLNDAYITSFDTKGQFKWAQTWGGTEDDLVEGITSDSSGNIYVTGSFQGSVDFDPGTGTDVHDSSGDADAYLSKFNASGNFQWARTWGGSVWPESGIDVACDTSGNVYVIGRFIGTVDFDPGSGTDEHTSNGSNDVFLSKFDSSGNFLKAAAWGGSEDDFGMSVCVAAASGDVFCTGSFRDTVSFNPGDPIFDRTSIGGSDVFLVKLDSSLSFQWVNAFGSDSPASLAESGLTVATDSYGNSFVGGAFEGTADFDPGASVENRTSTGGLDAFVVAFDSSGVFEWVDVWGGDQQDECRRISIDSDGLLAAGCFADSVDFDPGSGVDTHVSIGGEDISLSKLSTSGALLWARTCGAADDDFGNGVTNDGGGNVYFTGAFTGIVDFDPGPYLDYHSSENGKAFLARLNSQGLY